jgi:hypothetical protein
MKIADAILDPIFSFFKWTEKIPPVSWYLKIPKYRRALISSLYWAFTFLVLTLAILLKVFDKETAYLELSDFGPVFIWTILLFLNVKSIMVVFRWRKYGKCVKFHTILGSSMYGQLVGFDEKNVYIRMNDKSVTEVSRNSTLEFVSKSEMETAWVINE